MHATCPPPGPLPASSDAIAARYGIKGRWPTVPTLSQDARLLCACPWGNRYIVQQAPETFMPEGHHPGGTGTLVALRRLVHPIQPHASAAVAAFFTDVLGCPASLEYEEDDRSSTCVVPFASGPKIVFWVTADAPAADAYVTDELGHGYHLAFYTSSHAAFEAAFCAAEAENCLFENPRFNGGRPEFGNAMTYELAMQCGQFRVRDVRDRSGSLVLMLELEVRSPCHVSFPLGLPRE